MDSNKIIIILSIIVLIVCIIFAYAISTHPVVNNYNINIAGMLLSLFQ